VRGDEGLWEGGVVVDVGEADLGIEIGE